MSANFGHLARDQSKLHRLGILAERFFADDANPSLIKEPAVCRVYAQRKSPRSRASTIPRAERASVSFVGSPHSEYCRASRRCLSRRAKGRQYGGYGVDGSPRPGLSALKILPLAGCLVPADLRSGIELQFQAPLSARQRPGIDEGDQGGTRSASSAVQKQREAPPPTPPRKNW